MAVEDDVSCEGDANAVDAVSSEVGGEVMNVVDTVTRTLRYSVSMPVDGGVVVDLCEDIVEHTIVFEPVTMQNPNGSENVTRYGPTGGVADVFGETEITVKGVVVLTVVGAASPDDEDQVFDV